MFYTYIRVSTDVQTVENQRFAIKEYCNENLITVSKWVEETASGTIDVKYRKLGNLLKKLRKGDTIICSEMSRLGRDMLMIMSFLNECVCRGIKVIAVKGNYKLENNWYSKLLAVAYGISSELERDFISQRTKDALARKKSEGVILGRPKGGKNKNRKLLGKEELLFELIKSKVSITEIARILGINRSTIYRFVKDYKKPQC